MRVRENDKEDLRRFIASYGLSDIEASGCHFTWSNNNINQEDRIWHKLDRAMGNLDWFNEFLEATVVYHPPGISDHSPAVVSWCANLRGETLCATITSGKNLKIMMRKSQPAGGVQGNATICLCSKHRVKVTWLKEGDANTKFFHSVVKGRGSKNCIKSVKRRDGSVATDQKTIEKEFVTYFKSTLAKFRGCSPICLVIVNRGRKVDEAQCRALIREANGKQIWMALSTIGAKKSPGPDGFSASFFRKNWSVLGREFCIAIRHCFRHNALPKGTNTTFIALVPKSNLAAVPEDYRSISCCNVMYKVIVGILAKRIKEVIKDIIDPAQGAFIQGRVSRATCGEVLDFLKVSRVPSSWHLLRAWFKNLNQRHLKTRMIAAGVTATVVELWKARNSIIFRGEGFIQEVRNRNPRTENEGKEVMVAVLESLLDEDPNHSSISTIRGGFVFDRSTISMADEQNF
ncbi:hypothetical protein QQ045_031839 [Rhodiola kirilowii]